MNHKVVSINVSRETKIVGFAFKVCIKTGNLGMRTDMQRMLDRLLGKQSSFFRSYAWGCSIYNETSPSQTLQKEFVYASTRMFYGESTEGFRVLNAWVDEVEKQVGREHLKVVLNKS